MRVSRNGLQRTTYTKTLKNIPSMKARLKSSVVDGHVNKLTLQSAISSSGEDCVKWYGGLTSNDVYCLINDMCPCLDDEDLEILIKSLNNIYKEFYYYDLLSDKDTFLCECITFDKNKCDAKYKEKINALDNDDIYLIRLIINIYCKKRNKKEITLEDLQDPNLVKVGLIPANFDYDEFINNSRDKYCRKEYTLGIFVPETLAYDLELYVGTNGSTIEYATVWFFNEGE